MSGAVALESAGEGRLAAVPVPGRVAWLGVYTARGSPLMPCVLIVEDDMDVRELMNVLLTNHGFETMTATNGREALEQMRHRRPCLVLLDLMMPIMDGWEFRAEQLREPSLADVPVVCVTAIAEHSEMVRRLHAPCLRKPIEFRALLEAVEGACGSSH
jgi:CheY-like chemotaxis protein